MKNLLKPTLLVLISLILILESAKLAAWLMNQSNTILFYLGIILLIGCVAGFFFVTLENAIQLFFNIKNKIKK
jgi:multidrug efflux pump subunit AcrB